MKAILAVLALTISVSTVAVSSVSAATFTDDFSNSAFTSVNWTPTTTDSWSINNGTYGMTNASFSTPVQFSRINSLTNVGDFTMEYDSINSQDGGVFFHGTSDAGSGLVFILRPTFGDMYFIERAGGNFSGGQLGLVSSGISTGANARVRLTASGNTYTASVFSGSNLVSTTSINSSTYTTGAMGAYIYGSTSNPMRFDNVVVSTAVVPEPGTAALVLPILAGLPIVGLVRTRRKK